MSKLVLFSIFLSIPGFSQGQYVQIGAGSTFSSTDLTASIPGFSTSFSCGYNFDSGFNLEIGTGFDYLNFSENAFADNTLLFPSDFLLGYNFNFIDNSILRIQFGGSLFRYIPKLKNSQVPSSLLSYGLIVKSGLYFPVSENLSFSQTISNNLTFSDNIEGIKSGNGNDSYLSVSLGFEYYFNGNKNYVSDSRSETTDLYEAPLKKDSDSDGIADYKDDCPEIPGTKQNHGCPDEDTDNDGIPNASDNCPEEAETFNGFMDADGCPDSLVEKSQEIIPQAEVQVKLPDPILIVPNAIQDVAIKPEPVVENKNPEQKSKASGDFINLLFPKGSSTFKREQVEPLSEFAKKHKTDKEINLTVYCWETSIESDNLKLAEKRASNIKKFLLQMGISEKVLSVKSIGKKNKFTDSNSGQYYEVKSQ